METLLETIRAAIAASANDEARAAGAHACRTILTVLEAKPGEPLATTAPEVATTQASSIIDVVAGDAASTDVPAAPTAGADPGQIASMISALRGIPVDQLLDLAIARMRAALPKGIEVPRPEPVKFHIIQLPRVKR